MLATEKSTREFSGRVFSPEDIDQIKWLRGTYRQLSENELAATVCEVLGWLTPSGVPKKTQCVQFLRKLANEGIVTLPKPGAGRKRGGDSTLANQEMCAALLRAPPGEVTDIGGLALEIAQAGARQKLLRAYMKKYHTLGDEMVFGDRLYYFITDSAGTDLGCMRFSASSWALEDRERWIGWDSKQRKERLFLIVNNSRFLIFPWVRVRNLASRSLSMAAWRIKADWLSHYCYEPVLLETFVEREKYHGTSYKAANWELIGETKGRGRDDRNKEYALSVKDIYVYPLSKDFRAILKGEKLYKAVDPDGV